MYACIQNLPSLVERGMLLSINDLDIFSVTEAASFNIFYATDDFLYTAWNSLYGSFSSTTSIVNKLLFYQTPT